MMHEATIDLIDALLGEHGVLHVLFDELEARLPSALPQLPSGLPPLPTGRTTPTEKNVAPAPAGSAEEAP